MWGKGTTTRSDARPAEVGVDDAAREEQQQQIDDVAAAEEDGEMERCFYRRPGVRMLPLFFLS